jgi:quinol monooxygenase YgiN
MFAQVARFECKKDRRNHVEKEIASFRDAIKAEGIPVKQELILHNRNHNTWIAIALFDSKADLNKLAEHHHAENILKNLEPLVEGEIELFEGEVL